MNRLVYCTGRTVVQYVLYDDLVKQMYSTCGRAFIYFLILWWWTGFVPNMYSPHSFAGSNTRVIICVLPRSQRWGPRVLVAVVPSRQLESLQQQSAASTNESIQDILNGDRGFQFSDTLVDKQARKESGEKKHSFAPPSPGNQGNTPETLESPAAQEQESQETIPSVASSPSTPGGLNLGRAMRNELKKGFFR